MDVEPIRQTIRQIVVENARKKPANNENDAFGYTCMVMLAKALGMTVEQLVLLWKQVYLELCLEGHRIDKEQPTIDWLHKMLMEVELKNVNERFGIATDSKSTK